jgi:hypothetical protein
VSYRVDLKIPWLPRCVQIDDNLFVVKAELLEGDMRSVGPGASVVGVESDFWGRHVAMLCFVDGEIVDNYRVCELLDLYRKNNNQNLIYKPTECGHSEGK